MSGKRLYCTQCDCGGGYQNKKTANFQDILSMQCKENELLRLDIVVRLLAIENYYGKNDYGFDLYRKMQRRRQGEQSGEEAVEQFKKLILSYEQNGYDPASAVIVDKNLLLCDGSHRIACGIYFHQTEITINVLSVNYPVEYSVDWFLINGFSDDEMCKIVAKEKEILDFYMDSYLTLCLWPPALPYLDEIRKDISYYGKIVDEKRKTYSDYSGFSNIVKMIYSIDDIEEWKIEKKLLYMKEYAPEFIYMVLQTRKPGYRIKEISNLPIAVRAERLKRTIRGKYKGRLSSYFHDILIHTSDNQLQFEYIQRIFNPEIDVSLVLEKLDVYKYALTKVDVPYMSPSFPEEFPIGKDMDILCVQDDFTSIRVTILNYVETLVDYEIRQESDKHFNRRIRIEKYGHLFYQFDISYEIDGLNKGFVEEAVNRRIWDRDFYKLCDKYEYIYRLLECKKNSRKVHHMNYVNVHRGDFDEELANKYCAFDYKAFV